MIEMPTTVFLMFVVAGISVFVFMLWAVEKLMTGYIQEINNWEGLAKKFVDSCEIDGFGHVHDVHMGELTEAVKKYEELYNA